MTYLNRFYGLRVVIGLACWLGAGVLAAAELVTLTPANWDQFAPQGKEVDGIYGDFVLRNEQVVAVIARPVAGRNANMTVKGVGGALIDLTVRDRQSDQLSAYYPWASQFSFTSPDDIIVSADGRPVEYAADEPLRGKTVSWQCSSRGAAGRLEATVRYSLADGQPYMTVETIYRNPHSQAIRQSLTDSLRADRTFAFGNDEKTNLFWAYDEWSRQAYGAVVEGHTIRRSGSNNALELVHQGQTEIVVEPGAAHTIVRKIFPGDDLLQVRAVANRLAGEACHGVTVRVTDPAGPVSNAKVTIRKDNADYGWGRTIEDGSLEFELPGGTCQMTVEGLGRPPVTRDVVLDQTSNHDVQLPACGYVAAKITDQHGGPIPCKVAFHDRSANTRRSNDADPRKVNPYFGPDTGEWAVHNLYYSHDGQFRQEIAPGSYDVMISYGPEYDAVSQQIEVQQGAETRLEAKLIRSVDTPGWISSDFHSHSSPSGDNVSSQLGRVLNLLCEHIEFAPCTEHNRIDSYAPHLSLLGVEHLMATCTGIELTGSPLPVNHQNSFPLVQRPHTQDGGAPLTDVNPVVQIERLALWDGGSEKLLQGNHPNIPQILGDRDLDGKADGGFEKMFGFMDVIEVHPPQGIFASPRDVSSSQQNRNAIFHWLQLLNLGYRIPGVVNTDAHYNFHGSGGLRNYLKCPTDKPADIQTMDMVHAAEAGHIIMTNGPYLEVSLIAAGEGAERPAGTAGDEVRLPDGKAELQVRVQCPNWLDVNRVQVFLNGRPAKDLNFTRRTTPERFSNGVVKFDAKLPLDLKHDTHVIVAAAGEGLDVGLVMGPNWGKQMPTAVSNPIYIDIDGNGFQANGDLLDVPLPLAADRPDGSRP